ncbi:MAG: alcohol dehydrogenase catalytic domain-containing protein [Acidimicrobiia bacterium]
MRAAVTRSVGEPLVVADVGDPVPTAGEVLVRVTACGVCGSDLHLADALDAPGLVLGHEFAGEIVELGPGVEEPVRVGQRIAGFPLVGCGRCEACLTGSTSKCTQAEQLGLQRPGAFAELVTMAARGAFLLPASIDDRLGALVEPLAVAHHALDRTVMERGEPVLVIGGGPVGVAVALWARSFGAREVVVSDPVEHRRRLAERLGATATIDPTTEDVASVFARIAGARPGVVVECVGLPGLIQHAMDVAGNDARVTVVGVCMADDSTFPLTALQKELTTQYVLYYRMRDFTETIAALEAARLDPSPLVTGSFGLDALPDRFEALKHPTTECKILVEP